MPPLTRSSPRGEKRREEILAAAAELFADKGFRGTSLSSVAQRAGLTDAGLLHHFPSKEALLLALLVEQQDTKRRLAEAAVGESGDFLDRIIALVDVGRANPEIDALYTVLAAECTDPGHPGHHQFVERYRWLRHLIVSQLIKEQERGGIDRSVVPEVAGPQLLALMDGLQLQWLLEPEAIDPIPFVRAFLDSLRPQ